MITSNQESNYRHYLDSILDCYESAARIDTKDDYNVFRNNMLEMLLCIVAEYHDGQLPASYYHNLTHRIVKLQENTYKTF